MKRTWYGRAGDQGGSMRCECDQSPIFPRCNKNPEYCTKLDKNEPPDWCDDCNAHPGERCLDCGYTHNC